MKERPILFSAPMVRALLDGSKTQTRREMKWPWDMFNDEPIYRCGPDWNSFKGGKQLPYGQPGDRLWVRETFGAFGRWETRYSAKKGRDEWHFVDMTIECCHAYRFDLSAISGTRIAGTTPTWHVRPSIFMPRAASRMILAENCVRVERLQDISYEDALAEGAYDPAKCPLFPHTDKETPEQYARRTKFPQRWYSTLWEEINGAGSWDENPWVWVIEFKKIESSSLSTASTL